jgi:hypothetical protein
MSDDTHTLPAFTPAQLVSATRLLAERVSTMMGRKLEEADWTDVYCEAKGIPKQGWSNLGIDVVHEGLGVEHKMLRRDGSEPIRTVCGSTLMHPAATRSIRVPTDKPADEAMRVVLKQYADLIERRRGEVRRKFPRREPDMRQGWLLWQDSLVEFLYFEERMQAPDPALFYAEWVDRGVEGGRRKTSRNLWIFNRATRKKRFSVTTDAGAKIQPYFDVPAAGDPNLYVFRAQGVPVPGGRVQVWLSPGTARELERLVGTLGLETLSSAILAAAHRAATETLFVREPSAVRAVPVELTEAAYGALCSAFPGVSDEDRARTLASALQGRHE